MFCKSMVSVGSVPGKGNEAIWEDELFPLLLARSPYVYIYIIKIKIHSSCEIEDFVETHLCKLCVILRSRALRVVCPH